jgi:stage V sporulation protein G
VVGQQLGGDMDITEVRVFPVEEEKLKAYATITFDDCFVVRDLKVIHGNSGLFVAMPSKKRKDGTFKDIAHPLNNDFRAKIENAVLDAYEKEKGSAPRGPAPSSPPVESKTPDQIKPEDYAATDD